MTSGVLSEIREKSSGAPRVNFQTPPLDLRFRPLDLRFDHVQIFADAVASVETYAAVEARASEGCATLRQEDERAFDSTNRDVVAQLLWALQWRVVASCATSVVVAA